MKEKLLPKHAGLYFNDEFPRIFTYLYLVIPQNEYKFKYDFEKHAFCDT